MSAKGKPSSTPARRRDWLDDADKSWCVHYRDPAAGTRLGQSPRFTWDDAYSDMAEAIDAAFDHSSAGMIVRIQFSATLDHPGWPFPKDWEDDKTFAPYTSREAIVAACEAMRWPSW